MPVSQDGYRAFLQESVNDQGGARFTHGTIDSYCSGLNHIANQLNIDIWQLTDSTRLQQLIEDCSPTGQRAIVGHYSNGTAFNALKQWIKYVEQEVSATMTKSYLLTWNPANADEGGSDRISVGEEREWTCQSTKPVVGDLIYLMRVGTHPKGIVAQGLVTHASVTKDHWGNPDKTAAYIRFKVEAVRYECAAGMVPLLLLELFNKKHVSNFRWTPIRSGVEIPLALTAELTNHWQTSAGIHSLRQFVEWTQQDAKESRPKWREHYTARINEAKQYQSGDKPLDNALLDWLWRDGDNGVCSVAPGFLPNAAFAANIELLKTLTTDIMQSPVPAMHSSIKQRWQQAVKDGLFEKNYHAVINRVFATFAPEQFNTLVNSQHAKQVLLSLKDEFTLDLVPKTDWPAQQAQLNQCLEQADVTVGKVIENNIALWQLYEALESRRNKRSTETDTENMPLTAKGEIDMQSAPLNQIFFGPPGTGKTYVTIEAAVKAADPGFVWEDRIDLKARYDQLVNAGRICFVTFHQSYSYEDFVEGLTAKSEQEKIKYTPKDGLFKDLCVKARDKTGQFGVGLRQTFDFCWKLFVDELANNIGGVNVSSSRSSFLVTAVDANSIRFDKSNNHLALDTLRAMFDGQKGVTGGNQIYYESLINHIKLLGEHEPNILAERQLFVLVIDEINRGNISRIFGELITLIEPSKRIGAAEALEVTLPLTGDKFGVPDNLYIIGTMNTADRSLAGLDLALRRRFTFVEMPPKPELLDDRMVEGIDIGEMLRVMNQRITALLDRDHCIGHAYFMPLLDNPSLDLLADIFAQNILPLLQEYFFEDWQRIRWVLADQTKPDSVAFIVKDQSMDAQHLFPGVSPFKPRDCWRLNTDALKQVETYQQIYQPASAVSEQDQ